MSSFSRLLYRRFCTSPTITSPSASSSSPSLNTLLQGIVKERSFKKLVEKFKKCSEEHRFRCRPRFYEITVRRLADAKKFHYIEEILEEQKKYNDISKEGFAVRLISLYGKSGMFDHASKTFDQMPELKCPRTVMSFNALLTACVDSKNFLKADRYFRVLPPSLSVIPNRFTYNIMIRAFCEMGQFDFAIRMLDEMERNEVEPDMITFNTLLKALYEHDRFSDGEKIWAKMENTNCTPDNRSFNAKLEGLVRGGKTQEAVELVKELRTRGLKPDIFSFNSLIKGFCNEGNIEDAMRIYDDLAKEDCVSNRMTIQTIVPCLCKKGDFDLAFKLCQDSLNRHCLLDAGLLQVVVDGLVKESKLDEAKELVNLGRDRKYSRSFLKLPTGAEDAK
ncbi:pentatricopeptide repeat-containing protein At1g55890, mitochondrial-like [Macadamia integrifolia]|uniref:pentatricopeptide repeat-containing protein At1g55890, mitochondrial-like n=1 Tax=Macadamia integrifolia TaxID=60698 RepID=UPI001C4F6ADE|nr:pentatricopeptide repeat-containing protein At1g55890, mitochondrial-like [Macadamia integrifolia]